MTLSDVVVREAVPEEYAVVSDVTVRGYVGDGFADDRYAQVLADVEGRALHSEILVATLGGEGPIVGAVALAAWPSPVAEVGVAGDAVFRMLVVDPSARRQGVAEALVRECVRRAMTWGCHAVALSTMPGMTTAHRLYERLGFRRLPDRDWSPVPGVDLLVYGLDLTPNDTSGTP